MSAAPRQREGVAADVTLQMQNALAAEIADLAHLDRKERVFAPAKSVETIVVVEIAGVDERAFVPIAAIDFERVAVRERRG